MKKNTRREFGFSLIELLIVISMILILLSLAIPMYKQSILNAKETVLRDDLFTLRRTIDEFTYDQKRAPQSLDELVQTGYLHQLPLDPMTKKADCEPTMETDVLSEGVEIGIADIHSSSHVIGTDGQPYSAW